MRRIAIINQKGGVGKTTTTVNLAAALASAGQRVQVIDLDPQAHATLHLGVRMPREGPSIYNVLTGSASLADVRREIDPNLAVIGSHIDLAATEIELVGVPDREVILRDLLNGELGSRIEDRGSRIDEDSVQQSVPARRENQQFDYTLMDCPPSLGLLTLNALTTAQEVIIPLQPHFLALHGLSKLLETIALVSRRINRDLHVRGVVLCMVDQGTRLASEVIDDLEKYLESGRGRNVPWADARIFNARIRRNIRLAECPSFGQSIFQYAADSHGAADYRALALEVLEGEQANLKTQPTERSATTRQVA
ncbi:MAG: ParA family protein [Planctomycetes bacterium]|nr:ParA family protein [Planctomycetota bacterium]